MSADSWANEPVQIAIAQNALSISLFGNAKRIAKIRADVDAARSQIAEHIRMLKERVTDVIPNLTPFQIQYLKIDTEFLNVYSYLFF